MAAVIQPAGSEAAVMRVKVKKPNLLETWPQARLWVEAGISVSCAVKLVKAGYTDVKDLAGASRAELYANSGIGERTLVVLERLLGRPVPRAAPKAARPGTEAAELPPAGGLMGGAQRLITLARRHHKADPERESSAMTTERDYPREIVEEIASFRKRLIDLISALPDPGVDEDGSPKPYTNLRKRLWGATRQ